MKGNMLFKEYEKNLAWVKDHGVGGIPMDEAETIVEYMRSDKEAVIDTCDCTVVKKCLKLCEKDPDNWKMIGFTHEAGNTEKITGVWFKCPKKCVSFKGVRKLTEEQKQVLAERMRGRFSDDEEEEDDE